MGLDNGIVVKNVKPEKVNEFPAGCFYCNEEIEIAYWRKYWGIRNDIIHTLHFGGQDSIPLEVEDLKAILRVLKKYFNYKYYEDWAESIWEYDEAIEHMVDNYINIKWLINYKEEHPDAVIHFYDSY